MTIDELRAILERQDKEILIDFLIEEAKRDAILLNHLFTDFTDDWLDEERFGDRQQWLHEVLENIVVDWDGDRMLSEFALKALALFFRQVDRAITIEHFKEAIALLLIADEEISALDAWGVGPGRLLDEVSHRFDTIANASLDEEKRSELFWHLVKTYPDESRCRRLAFALSKNDDEWAALSALLVDDPYDRDLAYELLLKTADREEQERFLFERPDYHVWKRAIEDALDSGEWERAIRYCLGAQEQLSFFDVWKEFLLQAYMSAGMHSHARSLVFSLVLSHRFEYTKLKELVPPEEWNETVERLYEQMDRGDDRCASMLATEGRLDLLIKEVERAPHLLDSYWSVLKDAYHNRVAALLAKRCSAMVGDRSSRESFVHLARLLKALKSLGKERETARIIERLLERYPTKRMLTEELKQAGLMK